MASRKIANRVQMLGFVLFLVIQISNANIFLNVAITFKIFFFVVVSLFLVAASLYVIPDVRISEVAFICVAVVSTHLLGVELQSLPYSIVEYMVMSLIMVMIADWFVNVCYIVIVNVALIYDMVIYHEMISTVITFEYYIMLLIFLELMMIAQNLIVRLYNKKLKEIEEQNRLLNEAQKSKDVFLANMSHEIRTPMNAIVGMTELIMREDDTSEKVKEYCYNIQSSGENLLAIINDILDFSKIESGTMNVYYEPYSIASVVQDVANTAMFRRGYKELEIIVDCDPRIPKRLIGDAGRNRQILMNLMTNAVKYTEKGYVYIRVSCYKKDGDNWLRMAVSDTGIGIKDEDKAHLFETFSRMDTIRNRSIEGTGLGLPLCKRLVQAMNGIIEIQSEYGVGTTVSVDLPQEIDDEEPFLKIENSQDMKVAIYGDWDMYSHKANEYYKKVNQNMWSGFGVSYRLILSFEDVMKCIDKKEITHLYTGMGEYADQRYYFDMIAKKIKVIVIYDPQYPIKLGAYVHGLQLPYYSINMAASLKGETFYSQQIDKNQLPIAFKAPYARVLIVDDDDVNLRVAEGVLRLYDLTCVLAKSGKEAIELLKDQDIDLVFMDHMMPEMDGVETTRIIRRIGGEYGKNIPVIALTANAVNDAEKMFLEEGFQGFISKPINIKRVDSILRRFVPGTKIEWIDEATKKEIPDFDVMESETNEEMPIHSEMALQNMGNQSALYKELLEYCLELEEERWNQITESFEEKDWTEYAIKVHALKGGMRSLGVEELALVAEKQEKMAKASRIMDVIEGHPALEQAYIRAHKSIANFLERYTVE